MNLSRLLNSICLLLFFSTASYSQPTPKTLLWRISGHGLTKPSYLYGTMHLSDKRLFKFGDSVYHAIEASEGLAIEVNPDEMAAYTVNQLFDQMEKSKKLQDVLKEKDFNQYSAALEKKFKKPANKITTADVVKEKNKWMAEYMEKGEMPTFVDAYLYNIARRQGKWLGGIEDISDQAGLLEDMVDKSDIDYLLAGESSHSSAARDEGMEKMIALYNSQDLESIDLLFNGQDSPEHRDRMLIRRNVKMARRIDSLTSLRTMFLAIGAAHLPGDSGVIYLLRKKGFTVEPVFSSTKIDGKDYTFKEVHIPWFTVDDSQGLYTTLMPGNPASVKLYGIVEMKFLLDIFNMSGFCTMAVVSAIDVNKKDSIYNETARRMFQAEQHPVPKIISSNGIEGREYMREKKAANMRLQLFLYNRTLYASFMYAMKPAQLLSADADKFFASMVINKERSVQKKATVFTDPVMGISFAAPAPILYNRKMSNDSADGWKISAFNGADINSGTYISVYSKEVKPGHYILADSIIYREFLNNAKKQYQDIQIKETWLQGHKLQQVSGRNTLQPSLYMNAVNMIKNGRNIVVLAISDAAHLHLPAIDSVFSTLHFIDPPTVNWQVANAQNNLFSVQAPAPLRSLMYASGKKLQWCAYDTTSAISYNILPDTLGKYFWALNDSSYWKNLVTTNLGTDSLVRQTSVNNGTLRGVELLTMEKESESMYKRMRLLQDGDKVYKLFVSAEKELLYNDNTNNFFNSFTINAPAADSQFVLKPKTTILLAGLASRDSATRYDAYMALSDAPVAEPDRALLQEALYKKYYAWYDSSVSPLTNYEIAHKLAKLQNNATVDFVRQHYGSFASRADTLKNISLVLLAQLHTKESYHALAGLLQQSPPREPFDYRFRNALDDSLSLTAGIYPVLQGLAADTLHASTIAGIAGMLIDSGFIKLEELKPAENDFDRSASALLPAMLRADNYGNYQLLRLLGRFNTAASNRVLKNWLDIKNSWLKKEVVMELLKNGQAVPATALNSLAADGSMRSSLYSGLKEIKKAALFPAQYLTRAHFAEAAVYDAAANNDDYEISSIRLLEKRAAKYKGKQYLFYVYKVVFAGNDTTETYLGIAGGYTVNGTSLEPAVDISGIYFTKAFDATSIGLLLKEYLGELEAKEEETPDN
jgi:uncharacterized protein YbaP (TraB family)